MINKRYDYFIRCKRKNEQIHCKKEHKEMKVLARMKKKLVVNVRSNIFRNVRKFDFAQRWTLHFSNISDLSRYNILETFNDIFMKTLKEGRR